MRNLAILIVLVSFSVFSCRPANDVETVSAESILWGELQRSDISSEDSLWMEWERYLQRLMRTHQVNTGHLVEPIDFEKASPVEAASIQLNALGYLLAEYRLIHGELSADLWGERRRYAQLEHEFDKKQHELQGMQNEIENLVRNINSLQVDLMNSQHDNDSLDRELNRVYFAYGTADELHEADVVKIRSGWWTSAERVKLKRNLNTEYFSPADRRKLQELALFCHNAEVLTPHPPNSFKIVEDASGALLVITDSEKFWEQSRYLAVKVD